jgi:hypothetical protein
VAVSGTISQGGNLMQQYNYLQALYLSFYSKSFYRDVARNWQGGTFLYLLMLLAISWALIIGVSIQPTLNHELKKGLERYAPQFPLIKIDKGIVSTPENKPYYIKDPDTQETIGVIDTSGSVSWSNSIHLFLLTKTQLYWSKNKDELRIHQIPKDLQVDIQPLAIKNQLETWGSWLWLLFFPVFLIVSYVFRIIQTLLYAIVGKVLVSCIGIPLSYGKIVLLGLVSITPAIVICTILDCFAVSFPGEWLIYLSLGLGYLFFAIWANMDKQPQ